MAVHRRQVRAGWEGGAGVATNDPSLARQENEAVLNIIFFGSGGAGTLVPLEMVSRSHHVIALVRPSPSRSWVGRTARAALSRAGIGSNTAMANWAKVHQVPLFDALSGHDSKLTGKLKQLAPDVICVSAFPRLLGNEILQLAGLGALNLHSSLLPRHRGPNPLFWIYYHSDRRTGVTVHGMNPRADEGPIFAQETFELPRGFPVDRLYVKKATLGGELLLRVLDQLESGRAEPREQAEGLSTYAPRVAHGTRMVDFLQWDVERVWHFLAGLCPTRREPLCDHRQRTVRYYSVLGFAQDDCGKAPGLLESASFGWNLYCRGGSVQLGSDPPPRTTTEP